MTLRCARSSIIGVAAGGVSEPDAAAAADDDDDDDDVSRPAEERYESKRRELDTMGGTRETEDDEP